MRKISIALLVAMVMAGLIAAMVSADQAGMNPSYANPSHNHHQPSFKCDKGEPYMCPKKNVLRCKCDTGCGWDYNKKKCVKGYISHHSKPSKKNHNNNKKKKKSSCNPNCVKGTYHDGKCKCNRGWSGSKCDRKKVAITYSKKMGKHCGEGTECTKNITVKCRCKKSRSKSYSWSYHSKGYRSRSRPRSKGHNYGKGGKNKYSHKKHGKKGKSGKNGYKHSKKPGKKEKKPKRNYGHNRNHGRGHGRKY